MGDITQDNSFKETPTVARKCAMLWHPTAPTKQQRSTTTISPSAISIKCLSIFTLSNYLSELHITLIRLLAGFLPAYLLLNKNKSRILELVLPSLPLFFAGRFPASLVYSRNPLPRSKLFTPSWPHLFADRQPALFGFLRRTTSSKLALTGLLHASAGRHLVTFVFLRSSSGIIRVFQNHTFFKTSFDWLAP